MVIILHSFYRSADYRPTGDIYPTLSFFKFSQKKPDPKTERLQPVCQRQSSLWLRNLVNYTDIISPLQGKLNLSDKTNFSNELTSKIMIWCDVSLETMLTQSVWQRPQRDLREIPSSILLKVKSIIKHDRCPGHAPVKRELSLGLTSHCFLWELKQQVFNHFICTDANF